MKSKYLLKVKIRQVTGTKWYKKGETHLVLPKTTLSFTRDGKPHFQKSIGFYGILCSDCNILETVLIPKQ